MKDPVIAALQDRIVFDPDPPPLPDRFVHSHGGTMSIRLKSGREISRSCTAARGSGPRGMEWSDVEAKYRRLAPLCGMPADQVEESFRVVKLIDETPDVAVLTRLLTLR